MALLRRRCGQGRRHQVREPLHPGAGLREVTTGGGNAGNRATAEARWRVHLKLLGYLGHTHQLGQAPAHGRHPRSEARSPAASGPRIWPTELARR